jgi:hypothetical protein
VPNPVEILISARRRVAMVEATRAACYAAIPAVVAAVLAVTIRPLGALTWERWGYVLAPERAATVELAMAAIAVAAALVGVALGVRAWMRANDFILAAGEVDEAVGGHQQVLTLATLSDPSRPQPPVRERSALFPLLWRAALGFLTGFDPRRAFPLALGRPLARSSALGAALGAVMILATLGLVRAPTPLQATAARLRAIANEIASTSTDSSDLALASKVRDLADTLGNPKLPPEQKIEQLRQLMKEVERRQQQKGSGAQASKASGSGGSSPSPESSGKSKGKGQGKGTGPGTAEGPSKNGQRTAKNQQGEGGTKGGKKGEGQSIKLQNELAKAQAQIETANAKNPSPENKPGQQEAKGQAPKPGTSPNQKGAGARPNPNEPGNIPQQGAAGEKNIPQGGGNKNAGQDKGSNMGDTKLGEFPAPAKFQRYLKPGEKGELNIQDARYVMFRLPSATPVGAGGVSVEDKGRPKAATPYVNAPLKETGANAPPDERQMIPPRYRDLIH